LHSKRPGYAILSVFEEALVDYVTRQNSTFAHTGNDMSYASLSVPFSKGFSFLSMAAALGRGVKGVFESFTHAIAINATAQERMDRVAHLNGLTDAQLAAQGLKREDIVHHVFRDLFWN